MTQKGNAQWLGLLNPFFRALQKGSARVPRSQARPGPASWDKD